jgi:Flp pilus assembly protein TadD
MWGIGKAHQVLGDDGHALSWFERAATYEPDNPDILGEAYLCAAFVGDATRAEAHARRALDLRPENSAYRANYAIALLLGKRIPEAQSTAREAVQADPTNKINEAILNMINAVASGRRPIPARLPK